MLFVDDGGDGERWVVDGRRYVEVGGWKPMEVENGRSVKVEGGRPVEVGARLRVRKVLGRDDSSMGETAPLMHVLRAKAKRLLLTEIEVHWRAPIATATVTSLNLQS